MKLFLFYFILFIISLKVQQAMLTPTGFELGSQRAVINIETHYISDVVFFLALEPLGLLNTILQLYSSVILAHPFRIMSAAFR